MLRAQRAKRQLPIDTNRAPWRDIPYYVINEDGVIIEVPAELARTNSHLPMWFLMKYAFPCEHVIKDQTGVLNCLAFDSGVSYCSPEFCYKLNRNNGRRRKHSMDEVDYTVFRLSRRRDKR